MPPKLTPGAVLTEIPKYLVDQAMGVMRSVFGGIPRSSGQINPPQLSDPNAPQPLPVQQEMARMGTALATVRREPWFGPSTPMNGVAPRADVAGRAFDYPTGYNLGTTPRQYEPVSFPMLRGLYEGLDLAKICVETRKNQMSKLSWEILPRMKPGQKVRDQDDPRCHALMEFFRSPDRKGDWNTWMRMLLDDMLVVDAPAIYVRRTVGGDVYSLEVVKGDTITPRIDGLGRTPDPPETAYSQILKGVPAINYTSDELIYAPRNRRPGKVYGFSAIEQLWLTIQIAIRRDISKLQFWTEGNIPDALVGTPPDWTPDQIKRMQEVFDAWTTDPANRRKLYFIPGGTNYTPTRPAQTLDPQQDEWLARMITYAFNLPNLPLVAQQNRATSETANDAALREGLAPTIVWLKGLMDYIIERVFGFTDIEWVMDNYQEEDSAEKSARELNEVRVGALSIDEYRAERGRPPLGMGPALFGIGPNGIIFVDDLLRAHAQGTLALPMPAPPDAGALGQEGTGQQAIAGPPPQLMLPAPKAPANPASTGASLMPAARAAAPPPRSDLTNRAMADISPAMLQAVGLRPDYARAARPGGDRTSKAAPPMVLDMLRRHEGRFKGKS